MEGRLDFLFVVKKPRPLGSTHPFNTASFGNEPGRSLAKLCKNWALLAGLCKVWNCQTFRPGTNCDWVPKKGVSERERFRPQRSRKLPVEQNYAIVGILIVSELEGFVVIDDMRTRVSSLRWLGWTGEMALLIATTPHWQLIVRHAYPPGCFGA